MEKRALYAIALSVLVLFAFRYYQDRQIAELARLRPPVQKAEKSSGPSASEKLPASSTELSKADENEKPAIQPGDTSAYAQQINIEGGMYRAVIDNRGALLTSWQLKDYKSARGQVFEMVAAAHDAETRPYLGSLLLEDPRITALVNRDFYEVQAENISDFSKPLAPPVTITMRLRREGLVIEKRYRFDTDNYILDFALSVQKDSKPLSGRVLLGQDIGPEQEHFLNGSAQIQAVSFRDGKVRRDQPSKDEKEISKLEGEVRWAGLDMQYFSIIAIPKQPLPWFDIQKREVKAVGLDGKEVTRNLLRLTIPEYGSGEYVVYLGPKNPENLKSVRNTDLSGVIDYGMFSFLILPLLISLKWIYANIVHNYGAAIIVLTFLLTLLLFPFRLKQ